MEEAKKLNVIKDYFLNNLSRSQVFVAHSFWLICRNVSRTFVELCMETPYWCTVFLHQYGCRKSTNIFLFTRELAYVRLNVSSNTWNGYTAENQEERLFFRRDSIPILVSRTVKTQRFKLLYFRNETCYRNWNLYKDLLFVCLQPSVNTKNS